MEDETIDDVLPVVNDASAFEYHEWLPGIYKDIREYSCKSDPKRAIFTALESFLEKFRRYMRTSSKDYLGRKYDYHLAKHSVMIMYIFFDIFEEDDYPKFFLKLAEVLGNCMFLWMRYYSPPEGLFTSYHCQRIYQSYFVFLNHYSDEFLYLKIFAHTLFVNNSLPSSFYQTIKRYLITRVDYRIRRDVEVKEDQLYILYILAFKQLEIHRPPGEQGRFLDIPTYGNSFMRPKLSLLSNHRYAPYLPALTARDVENGRATHIILKKLQNQFLIKLAEAAVKEDWLKGSDVDTIITVDLSGDDDQVELPEPENPTVYSSEDEESYSSTISERSCEWPAKFMLLDYARSKLAQDKEVKNNEIYRLVDTIDIADETENEMQMVINIGKNSKSKQTENAIDKHQNDTDIRKQCAQQPSVSDPKIIEIFTLDDDIDEDTHEPTQNCKISNIAEEAICKLSKTLETTSMRNELDVNQNLPNSNQDLCADNAETIPSVGNCSSREEDKEHSMTNTIEGSSKCNADLEDIAIENNSSECSLHIDIGNQDTLGSSDGKEGVRVVENTDDQSLQKIDLTISETTSDSIRDSGALILPKDSEMVRNVRRVPKEKKVDNHPPNESSKILVKNTPKEEVVIDSIDLDDPLENYEEAKCLEHTETTSPDIPKPSNDLKSMGCHVNDSLSTEVRGIQSKSNNVVTDTITRSSNRTMLINYKDDGGTETKPKSTSEKCLEQTEDSTPDIQPKPTTDTPSHDSSKVLQINLISTTIADENYGAGSESSDKDTSEVKESQELEQTEIQNQEEEEVETAENADTTILASSSPLENIDTNMNDNHIQPEQPMIAFSEVQASGVIFVPSTDEFNDVNNELYELEGTPVFIEECNEEIICMDVEHQTNEDEPTKCMEEVEIAIVQDSSMLQVEENEGILLCDGNSVCADENITEICNNADLKEQELEISDVQTEIEIEMNESNESNLDEQHTDISQILLSNGVNEDSTSNLNILSEVCSARVEENSKMAKQEAFANENLLFDNTARSKMCSKVSTLDIKQTKDDKHIVEERETFVDSRDKLDAINQQEYNACDDEEPLSNICIDDTKPKSPVNAVENDFVHAACSSQEDISELNFSEHNKNVCRAYEEPSRVFNYYIDNNTKRMEVKNNLFDDTQIPSSTAVSSRHDSIGREVLLPDARNLEGRVLHLRSPDEDSHISTSSIVDESETYDNVDHKTDDVHIGRISSIEPSVASANKCSSEAQVLFSISTGKKLSPPTKYKSGDVSTQSRRVVFSTSSSASSTQKRNGSIDSNMPSIMESGIGNQPVFTTDIKSYPMVAKIEPTDSYNFSSNELQRGINPTKKIGFEDFQSNYTNSSQVNQSSNLISKRRNQIVRKRGIIAQADENIQNESSSSAKRKAVPFAPLTYEKSRLDINRSMHYNSTIIERKTYDNPNTIQNQSHVWKSSINSQPIFNQLEESANEHEDSELDMLSTSDINSFGSPSPQIIKETDENISSRSAVEKKTKKVTFNLLLNEWYEEKPFHPKRFKRLLHSRRAFKPLKACIQKTAPEFRLPKVDVKNTHPKPSDPLDIVNVDCARNSKPNKKDKQSFVKEINIKLKSNTESLDQISSKPFKWKKPPGDFDRYLIENDIPLTKSEINVERNLHEITQNVSKIDKKMFNSFVRVPRYENIIKKLLRENKRKQKFEQLSRKQQDNEILKRYSDEKLRIIPSIVLSKYDENYNVNSRVGTSSLQAQHENEQNIKKEKLSPWNRDKIRVKMYTKNCKNFPLRSLSREIKHNRSPTKSLSTYNAFDLSKSINVNSTHVHGYLYRRCVRPIRTGENNTDFILQVFHGQSDVCMKPCIILLEHLRRFKELLHQNNLKYNLSRYNQYKLYPKMIFKSELNEETEQSCITEFEESRNCLNNSKNEKSPKRYSSSVNSSASNEEDDYGHINKKSRCYGSKIRIKNSSKSILNKCSLKTESIHHNTNLSQSQLCEAKQSGKQEDTSSDIVTLQYSYTLQDTENNEELHTSKLDINMSFTVTDEFLEFIDELKQKSDSLFDEPLTSCDTHVPVDSNDCGQINNLHDTTDNFQESPLVLLAEGSDTFLPVDELPPDNVSETNDSPIELFDRINSPCDDHESDFETREHSFKIKAAKTYSASNIIQTVFVPPELEMNFDDLKESST